MKDILAFPTTQTKDDIRGNYEEIFSKWHSGMTLRDYFAGQALMGMCSALTDETQEEINGLTIVDHAYKFADAMLSERSKNANQ